MGNKYLRLTGFMIASFFLFMSTSPSLYAKIVVKSLGYGTAEKTIWREEAGQLKIVETGPLKEGEQIELPDGWDCRICVQEEEVVLDVDGKQVKLIEGEIFDVKEGLKAKGLTSYVKVTEGEVVHQPLKDGKPFGEPYSVPKGSVLLGTDCYSFKMMSVENFEALQEATQAAAQTTQLPNEEEIGDDPTPEPPEHP